MVVSNVDRDPIEQLAEEFIRRRRIGEDADPGDIHLDGSVGSVLDVQELSVECAQPLHRPPPVRRAPRCPPYGRRRPNGKGHST